MGLRELSANGFIIKAAAFSDDGIGDINGTGKAHRGKKDRVDFDGKHSERGWLGWNFAAGKGCGVLPNKSGCVPHRFVTALTSL